MTESLADLLDLARAWKRVGEDLAHRVFYESPFEQALIQVDLEEWLDSLRRDLSEGRPLVEPLTIIDVPKVGGAMRPGCYLPLRDHVVFTALVGACFRHIHQAIYDLQGTIELSYPLPDSPDQEQWLKAPFRSWRRFREESLKLAGGGCHFIVMTDISAYYENIDIGLLISDLKDTGCSQAVVGHLRTVLNKWAQVSGRGIPQGCAAADMLGKLYLQSVDRNLRAMGYRHLRYVDDIRIFCRTRAEARRALADLIVLLRKRGLHIQTKKTEILRKADAVRVIDGIQPILTAVEREFVRRAAVAANLEDDYINVAMAEAALAQITDDTPIEVIREAYDRHIRRKKAPRIDKTLFRFLLGRLGRQSDFNALDHCIGLLTERPEETHTILSYIADLNAWTQAEPRLVEFLLSPEAIYPYQSYQILEKVRKYHARPSEPSLAIARRYAFEEGTPGFLRAVCRAFLGDYGTAGDLERLEDAYSRTQGPRERAELLCALSRMERGRRNNFIARVANDSELNRRAAILVKENRLRAHSA